MAHYSRLEKIVIDAAESDHDTLVAFWQGAVGHTAQHFAPKFPEFHGMPLPGGDFGMLIQRLGSGPARVHLDFHTTDVAAETARLEALGATRVAVEKDWQIMRDPAGLQFCVVPAKPGELTDDNATRWDS